MTEPVSIVLVPGLLTSPRLYAEQLLARLDLLDTSARPDTPELTRRRQAQIALARAGRFAEVADQQFPLLIHPSRHGDAAVRGLARLMAEETGAEAFIRQQQAIIGRVDSRPGLGAIGCPTLVLVGDSDQLTPPELSAEIAGGIPGARLHVVASSGHLTPLDQPEQVRGPGALAWALPTWKRRVDPLRRPAAARQANHSRLRRHQASDAPPPSGPGFRYCTSCAVLGRATIEAARVPYRTVE